MLISDKMNAALNEQIGHEFGASLQYVAIAAYFDCDNLPELAAHFYRQADEERMHAMRIVKYVIDARGIVDMPGIPAPKSSFASAEEAVKDSLDWELKVTEQIHNLMNMAIQENDHTAHTFLQWFVTEQLEEVSSMETLLGMIRRAGNERLLLVEHYLSRQKSAEPASAAIGS